MQRQIFRVSSKREVGMETFKTFQEYLEHCAAVIQKVVDKVKEIIASLREMLDRCETQIPMAVMAVIAISNIAANKPPRECMHPT